MTGTSFIASSEPEVTPSADNVPPTSTACVASTPNTNCGDVVVKAYISTGISEPYSPYAAGSPAIWAYPIDIGIDTNATIIPAIISFFAVLKDIFFKCAFSFPYIYYAIINSYF